MSSGVAHVRSRCGLNPGFYLTPDEQGNKLINPEAKHKDNNCPSDSSRPHSYATFTEAEPSFSQLELLGSVALS